MIDGVGVRLGPLCDRLLKPHAGSLIEGISGACPDLSSAARTHLGLFLGMLAVPHQRFKSWFWDKLGYFL